MPTHPDTNKSRTELLCEALAGDADAAWALLQEFLDAAGLCFNGTGTDARDALAHFLSNGMGWYIDDEAPMADREYVVGNVFPEGLPDYITDGEPADRY